MNQNIRVIDTHTHLYFATHSTLEELAKAGYEHIFNLSYFPVMPSGWQTLYDLFRWLAEEEPKRFESVGIKYHACVGLHPRCVMESPEDNQIVIERLGEFLNFENVCGIGEVGLELVTDDEISILMKQLEVAKSYEVPVIIHTPRKNKMLVTEKIVEILQITKINPEQVVIDHVNKENIDVLLNTEYNLGFTIQEGKLTAEEFLEMFTNKLEPHADRILLNSDSGRDPSNPFAVIETAKFLLANDISKGVVREITYQNAKRVFSV
ncbi:MAG: TatD family hydrolase [Candidatus Asgardarchaeia archaeon]